MTRALTIRNLYDKVYSYLPLSGEWTAIGHETEDSGVWLIFGKEKNGKTTFALKLANYLSSLGKVLYISAEEGYRSNITKTCQRVGIPVDNNSILLVKQMSLDDIYNKLKKRKSPRFIFIDNLTEYKDEIKSKDISKLMKSFPDKLFIFIAHEGDKKGEPDGTVGIFCRKKADRIFHVVGLSAQVMGRTETVFIPVDNEKAALFHGEVVNQNNQLYGSNQ